MLTTSEKFNRPETEELVVALESLMNELKRIANIRYVERLEYHRIYGALETGQAALARFKSQRNP